MSIEEDFQRYRRLRRDVTHDSFFNDESPYNRHIIEVQKRYSDPGEGVIRWMLEALVDADPPRRRFAGILLDEDNTFEERFFEPLLIAGINEWDPSYSKYFIRPAVQSFGSRRVARYLLDQLRRESGGRQALVINALYWVEGDLIHFPLSDEEALPADRKRELADERQLWEEKDRLYLDLFVGSGNLDVQRNIIPRLRLDEPESYPEDLRPLLEQATRMARRHSDRFIRERARPPSGRPRPLSMIPPIGSPVRRFPRLPGIRELWFRLFGHFK